MASESSRGGWISTLLGAGLLAVAGFGFGMLVGGLWESPDLVFHYLLGNTEEVAPLARETAPPASGRSLSASSPPAAETAATQPQRRAGKEVDLPAVSARPPAQPATTAHLAVQVGAFAESRSAEKLAAGLRAKGYPVYLSPGANQGDARWRVRVGPFASEEEARRTAVRLKSEERLPTWVLSEEI